MSLIYCECGCGGEIKIGRKYIFGHTRKGKTCTEKTKDKISKSSIGNVPWNKGKKCPEISKRVSGINHPMFGVHRCGENAPCWRGGITPLHKSIRQCDQYINWRTQIFGRDNFTCRECGQRGIYFEAHHIKKFSNILYENNITTLEQALQCNELWDLNNGITLCKECHNKTKGK